MQLTREQYAIAESLGCRFLPATESQIHRLSMQQRIFWLDGKAFVVSRRDGFHETAGTLRRLLAHAPAPGLATGPSGSHAATPPADVPPAGAAQASAAPAPRNAAPSASLPQASTSQPPTSQAPASQDVVPRAEARPAVEASPPPPAQDAPAPPPPAATPPAESVARRRRIAGRTASRTPEQPALALQDASPDIQAGTVDSPAEAAGDVAEPPEPTPVAAPAEGEELRADAAAALLAGAGLGSLGTLLQPEALARKRPRKQIPGLLAPKKRDPVSLTVQIVAAHVSNNAVQTTDLPNLIAEVHRALTGPVGVADGAPEPVRPPPVAASPTRRRAESAQKG